MHPREPASETELLHAAHLECFTRPIPSENLPFLRALRAGSAHHYQHRTSSASSNSSSYSRRKPSRERACFFFRGYSFMGEARAVLRNRRSRLPTQAGLPKGILAFGMQAKCAFVGGTTACTAMHDRLYHATYVGERPSVRARSCRGARTRCHSVPADTLAITAMLSSDRFLVPTMSVVRHELPRWTAQLRIIHGQKITIDNA